MMRASPRSLVEKDRFHGIDRLLAKSVTTGPAADQHTLQGHTGMVVAAAHQLLSVRGAASLKAVGLPETALDRLRRIVLIGAFVHDLGKCSLHFQEVVRGQRRPQLVRHEAATLWLAWPGRPLGAWLAAGAGSDDDLKLALCAAAGHHRKFWNKAIASEESGAGSEMPLLVHHPDFHQLLERAASLTKLALAKPPVLEHCSIQAGRESPEATLGEWEDDCRDLVRQETLLLAVAKALVLNADVAGSAIAKSGERLSWVEHSLENRAHRSDFLSVVDSRLNGKPLRTFQKHIAAARAPITLVVAGCGSGKTIAAYQWAADQHSGRQLWVTYPTTGTATEGYRDYVADPDLQLDARLEHSRAEIDLEMLSQLPEGEEDVRRDQDRLDAVRCWESKVVTSTADAVLGLIQNQRKGLYAWAGIANAAVVFDEIHSYDSAMFGALLRFLRDVRGVPVLLMTASLPVSRRAALEKLSSEVHGRTLEVIPGPADLEIIHRYQLHDSSDHWLDIERCLAAGGKVLYVSNTVDRCKASVEAAAKRGLKGNVYHSRFRYVDRLARHRDVIQAFQRPGSALALTTQVAEMSLDLSADLLVTDCAPVAALIQRLGRLNRRATPDCPGTPKPFIVLDQPDGLPYTDAELAPVASWLDRLGNEPLSQTDLISAWDDDNAEVVEVASAWLDGGFRSEPAELREPGIGIQVMLESDAAAVRAKKIRAVSVALPMLPRQGWLTWPRVDGYIVPPAAAIHYDHMLGATWA